MKIDEFICSQSTPEVNESNSEELDVQKAVVESLAADKAEQEEQIKLLKKTNNELRIQLIEFKEQLEKIRISLNNVGDILAKNTETELSNKIALLDYNTDIKDRFSGETRDQVLEAIRSAHDEAEKEGRIRRAQLLEGVLVVNEPTGTLSKRREALEKFFQKNGNIISGAVIDELNRCGISYKNGNDYLLPSEIIKRTY